MPWVTLTLIAINMVAAVVLVLQQDRVYDFGFTPAHPSLFTAFTCLFLHASLLHLLGNMIFLAGVGPLVELAVGRVQALAIYLIGGLAGVAGYWLMVPPVYAETPVVGASGALAAWIGYAAVRYMTYRVPVAPKIGVPVGMIGGLWIVLQLVGGFVGTAMSVNSGVAYWSHAAGFLAGLLMSLVFRTPKKMSMSLGHEVLEQMNQRGPAAVLRAAELHLKQHPNDPKALRQKAEALDMMHERDACAQAWIDYLAAAPESEHPEVMRHLEAVGGLKLLPPLERAKLADRMRESHPQEAIILLESLVALADDEPNRPDALLALAILFQADHPTRTEALLGELKAKYAFHGAAETARAKGLLS